MNNGITRINIVGNLGGNGAYRFKQSQDRQPAANRLYREIFTKLGMELLAGDAVMDVGIDEYEAGYDKFLGIDVILTFADGQEATLQEKFLFTPYQTVTVEYMQNNLTQEHGDWFNMKCDYYFVGYDRIRENDFQEYILLNWPMVKSLSQQGRIDWGLNTNKKDGARASFRYANFWQFPADCVMDSRYTIPD
ncbi:MAG TPA: hypothetical protein VLA24_09420 [Pseudomonadales bacterium]|nr:hypothetical protein [Pseudomonadales bacterium]